MALRIHHSLYFDETSFRCHWHLPETHYLEQWGDVRAYDGTVAIIQPLIAPLYQGKSSHELIGSLLGERNVNGREIVQNYWRGRAGDGNFDQFWRAALQKGVIPNTAAAPVQGRHTAPSPDARPRSSRAAKKGASLQSIPGLAPASGHGNAQGGECWLQAVSPPRRPHAAET